MDMLPNGLKPIRNAYVKYSNVACARCFNSPESGIS